MIGTMEEKHALCIQKSIVLAFKMIHAMGLIENPSTRDFDANLMRETYFYLTGESLDKAARKPMQ